MVAVCLSGYRSVPCLKGRVPFVDVHVPAGLSSFQLIREAILPLLRSVVDPTDIPRYPGQGYDALSMTYPALAGRERLVIRTFIQVGLWVTVWS